jgi:LysM repeat protein
MDVIYRKPEIKVRITRPNWKNTSNLEEFTIVTFEPIQCTDEEKSRAAEKWKEPKNYDAKSDGLLAYSYTESRQDEDSPFTLSITPEQDNNRLTWADKIDHLDLVFIEEFGKVRYAGIVHRVRYSSRMGEKGPERSVMVEGNGFGELLKRFQLVLDTKLFINTGEEIKNLQGKSEFIAEGNTFLKQAIMFYYNNFKTIIAEKSGNQKSVLGLLIEKYISLNVDKNCNTLLPICQSMYQMGVNTLWDIVRKIVPDPFYELFGRWDTEKGKYIIFVRQCPYRSQDWKALPSYKVKPIILKEQNVGYDDSDVSTVYYATAPSFGYTNNMVMVVDNLHKNIKVDEDRWKKYGYRPLSVELSFLKRDGIKPNNVEKSLAEIGELLESWYKDNDRFLSEIISVISHEDDSMRYPAVGGRLEFIGQFYIDEIKRKWTYGNSPMSEIKVIRGGQYFNSGKYAGPIPNLGIRLQEFEELADSGEDEKSTLQEAREASATPEPEQPEQYTVKAGDTLQSIAANLYGDGGKWQPIYYANTSLINDPDMIYPGTVLKIPRGI